MLSYMYVTLLAHVPKPIALLCLLLSWQSLSPQRVPLVLLCHMLLDGLIATCIYTHRDYVCMCAS